MIDMHGDTTTMCPVDRRYLDYWLGNVNQVIILHDCLMLACVWRSHSLLVPKTFSAAETLVFRAAHELCPALRIVNGWFCLIW